jgi:hypothetical protein
MESSQTRFARNPPLVTAATASALVLSLAWMGMPTGVIPSARSSLGGSGTPSPTATQVEPVRSLVRPVSRRAPGVPAA